MSTCTKCAIGLWLAFLCACGGGGGGGAPLTDLTGTWSFYRTEGGIDDDPVHVTVVQSGSAVTFELTCNAAWPLGSGSYAGGVLQVTFDLGGGEFLNVDGSAAGAQLLGTWTLGMEAGTWRMEPTPLVLDCTHACDPVVPVQFVASDFTDLSKVEEISLFRSSAGHDYSSACEDCRSMKHYYAPAAAYLANNLIEIHSPVDGTIVAVSDEGHGASPPGENKQVRIRSSLHSEYTFILFHVDLISAAIVPGKVVTAGEQVGWARMWYPDLGSFAHDYDIAVRYYTPYGERFVSFFDVMTDTLFASYQARGAATRADFILPQATRDADALTCSGETFTSTGVLPAWFVLFP